jgi:predicted permease
LSNLRTQGPGFDTTNLLAFRVDPNRDGYTEARSLAAMHDLLVTLREVPEVQSVGISGASLLNGGSWNSNLTIDAGDRIPTTQAVHCNAISEGFFESLGVRLLSGRGFDERDTSSDPDPKFRSAVVNESFAKRYFGDKSPLGARIGFGVQPDTKTDMEIVGVVQTFSYRGLREIEDQAFFPFFEGSGRGGGFYVRTRSASTAAFASIRAAVRKVDPGLPVESLRTVDDQLDRSLSNERLLALLATAFAALAVLLAVVGLYGVTSFVVTSRTREIGIRIALGATRLSALILIVRDTAVMVLAGVAIALPAVWGLGRLVQSQLFGVAAMDARTVIGCAVLIVVVALGAAALPARRAAALNPVEALRCE